MSAPSGWATQQLAEFLAVVTAAAGDEAAVSDALERLAESFEADAGAFLERGQVTVALGWPAGSAPCDQLAAIANGLLEAVEVPGVGSCEVVAIPVDRDADSVLVLARGGYRFSAEETGLLRGMAKVLSLGLKLLGTVSTERRQAEENRTLVSSLRERQALLERLSRIQRKISSRAPLPDVLDAITAGAAELLGDEVVGLRLIDENDPTVMVMVSSIGVPNDVTSEVYRLPADAGVGGRAIAEDRLCVTETYADWTGAIDAFTRDGLQSAMGAPVHLEGRPVGSLVVATHRVARTYSELEREILIAFAEHASLALNDARTVQAMNTALGRAVHQAMHDDLTGLPNRACFYDRAEQALRAASRQGCRTAVLLFDLDRFKEINDTLGHKYGDRLLREVGPRMRTALRDADTLARLGGDEFCVLLPGVDHVADALDVAQRVISILEEPFHIDGMILAVEASCGIALAPDDGDSADLLLQRADVAMYVAKNSHAHVVTYSDDLNVNTRARLALLGGLRSAIAEGQLVLHYQPHAALTTGVIDGVEALVRWDHPERGLIGPAHFIPIAEHTGLIKPLTTWVLNEALRQRRSWLDDVDTAVPETLSTAINMSPRSLLDDDFPAEVVAALDRWDVPASLLELEVTESMIMADPERAHRVLSMLADIGVRLAIDDFGTGYSSLAYLKHLPVSRLKIDRSFVVQMRADPNDAIIVRSVIDLARNLGLQTVAEGVEDFDTWRQLRGLRCDSAQGYFLGKPMPGDDLDRWLGARVPPSAAAAATPSGAAGVGARPAQALAHGRR